MKIMSGFFLMLYTLVIYLGLPLLGWGLLDVKGFLANPARLGYAIVILLMLPAAAFQAIAIPSGGVRQKGEEDKLVRRQSYIKSLFVLGMMGVLVFLALADRCGIAVLNDSLAARFTGLVLLALGPAGMFWSAIAMGRQYSTEVTIQQDHHLITSGPFRLIRHPRYLGLLVTSLGMALVFRSWAGLFVCLLVLAFLIVRIGDEEGMMRRVFGAEWESYCQRSWRLLPYIY